MIYIMTTLEVYVIHSSKSLSELSSMLNTCGDCRYVGIIYKSIKKPTGTEKGETRKTIVICDPSCIATFKHTYPEHDVKDYDWSSFPSPNPAYKESWDLHIAGIPNTHTSKEASDYVNKQLAPILDSSLYTTDFVTRSRATGEIYGFGKIKFQEGVSTRIIKLCKIVLHNTPVVSRNNSTQMISCVWHRTSYTSMPMACVKTNLFIS